MNKYFLEVTSGGVDGNPNILIEAITVVCESESDIEPILKDYLGDPYGGFKSRIGSQQPASDADSVGAKHT